MKKIPGSTDYLIDLKGVITNDLGKVVDFGKRNSATLEIVLFGKKRTVERRWLSLLAWYECGSIASLQDHLDKIRFCEAHHTLRVTCGYVMVFKEPIFYKEGFRYVPSFPRYAVSREGVIVDTETNLIVPLVADSDGYITPYLRSPDKGGNRNVRLHRMLGLAWLKNFDFINKPIINHIDAVRDNNALTNLEWCSHSHNTRQAFYTTRSDLTVKMKVRDAVTGEVTHHDSVVELSKFLGVSTILSKQIGDRLPGHLYRKRYEVKFATDDSPWEYEGVDYVEGSQKKAYYTITMVDKETGETSTCSSLSDFKKMFKLWVPSDSITNLVDAFRNKYPHIEISYVRNALCGPYQVHDLESRNITIVASMKRASEITGVKKVTINFDLNRKNKVIYSKRWVIVAGTTPPNLKEYVDKKAPYRKIEITYPDGSVFVADSIRHAAKTCGIEQRSIFRALRGNRAIRKHWFRSLEE